MRTSFLLPHVSLGNLVRNQAEVTTVPTKDGPAVEALEVLLAQESQVRPKWYAGCHVQQIMFP